MPSCIAPCECDINYCNAMQWRRTLVCSYCLVIVHDRSACLSKQCICMQASQCIVTHHGSSRDVLHAWGQCTHKRACVHAYYAYQNTRMQMHAKIVKNIMDFSLFSRNTLPPTKYRNPKTEHRIEIYLNISDYM